MPTKNRHHFVPRFYLGAFSCAEERIHILHLSDKRIVEAAGVRGQCRRHHFYGRTSELEDGIADLEDQTAPVIKRLCDSALSPVFGSQEHWVLLNFVVLQWVRTAAAVRATQVGLSKLRTFVSEGSGTVPDPLSERDAIAMTLSQAPSILPDLGDLLPIIVRAPEGARFATSDSPLCRFNSFCQDTRWRGVLGTRQAGLQFILPLDSKVCLLFIDPEVYLWLGEGRRSPVVASRRDVDLLNTLQVLCAEENVYFSDLADSARLLETLRSARRDPARGVRAVEAVSGESENDRLLHTFEALPEIRIALSFLSERTWAKKVPVGSRRKLKRRPRTPEEQRVFTPLDDGKPHFFKVRREL